MDFDWLTNLRGRFLVFDGPDGSGKTTQQIRFARACRNANLPITEVREPGGTELGERIRDILLTHADEDMSATCEMLLYMASRAQLVEKIIRPALARNELVLADRFVSSTLAYQGTAGGVSPDAIRAVAAVACQGVSPDLVVIFDVDEATASRRVSPLLDRMEAKGAVFHARVRQGYLDQATRDPNHVLVLDATRGADAIFDELMTNLRDRLASKSAGA